MSAVSMQVSGMDEVITHLKAKFNTIKQQADRAVQNAGITCHRETVQNWPVGTPESTGIKGYHGGRSRQAWQYRRVGPGECVVGNNVVYSPFIEFGTYKMKARPCLRPAARNAYNGMIDELKAMTV